MDPVSFSQTRYSMPYKYPQDSGYVVSQPVETPKVSVDYFEKQNGEKKMLTVKQAGIGIIAAALLAVAPTAYYAGKKGGSKAVSKKMEGKIKDLTNTIKELQNNIGEVVKKQENGAGAILVSKKAQLTAQLLGLASVAAINDYVNNNRADMKTLGYSDDEITEAAQNAINVLNDKSAKDIANTAVRRIDETANKANAAETTANGAVNKIKGIEHNINIAMGRANEAISISSSGVSPTMARYLKPYYGLNLLQVLEFGKKIDKTRTQEVLKDVNDAARIRLHRSAPETIEAIKAYKEAFPQLTATWSITAEYKPIKKGGLGDVPVDIQDNFTRLGIDTPQFMPMYLKGNVSELTENEDGTYTYNWAGKEKYKLSKMAETTINTYRNGEVTPEKVEFFVAKLPVTGSDKTKQLIFIKNDAYFNENIYDCTTTAEETEKFAFMSKAVYELAKYKVTKALYTGDKALSGVAQMKIADEELLEGLKAPNSMILNDWHAGTVAGLCRYKAPMEYNYKEIPEKTYRALKDIPLLEIGHNLSCQGKSNDGNGSDIAKNRVAENIINTLFDHHAVAIAENAHSGVTSSENVCNTVLLERTEGGKHFNHLFMGVALSDWFVPVSKNYAKEIIADSNKSYILQALLLERQLAGDRENTIGGIINGTDKNKHSMEAVSKSNYVEGLKLEVYNKDTNIDEIMKNRMINKGLFYNKFIKPLLMDKTYEKPIEIVGADMNITEEEFVNAPFIAFAHRLTDQKGAYIMKGAIFKLFDNWEALPFKDKPKPFFLVGGLPESEGELAHLEALKNPEWGVNKKDRIDHTIVLKGEMPNPAIMSACQYFCAPSTFEPCGLIQGESFAKGTPVLTTPTGGFVDTVTNGKTGFLSDNISEDAYYETLVKALDVYYNKPEEYKSMVKNALNVDFSWAQEGKKGPIYEYTTKLGFDTEKLPDIAKKQ